MSMRHFLNFSKLRKIGHLTFEKRIPQKWDAIAYFSLLNFIVMYTLTICRIGQLAFHSGRHELG